MVLTCYTGHADLTVQDLIIGGCFWDQQKVSSIYPWGIQKYIFNKPISHTGATDHLIWKHNSDGQYTVKHGSQLFR